MIKLTSLLREDKVKGISLQQVIDNKLFGPVYHGTSSEKRDKIGQEGFKIFYGKARTGDVTQGYEISDYYGGIPAPVHHLGFGVYFTTVKAIAKQFAYGTTAGMKSYYLDVPRLETINFGVEHKMMKWWRENGYDYRITPQTTFGNPETNLLIIEREQYAATVNMTNVLKHKYDAVWFKGRGIRRLLDGDQVVVYDPDNIYVVDKSLTKPGEIGSKVIMKVSYDPFGRGEIRVPMGTKGILLGREKPTEFQKWAEGSEYIYTIYFKKGGKQYNILDKWVEFV